MLWVFMKIILVIGLGLLTAPGPFPVYLRHCIALTLVPALSSVWTANANIGINVIVNICVLVIHRMCKENMQRFPISTIDSNSAVI